jgi:hypothetical protein
MKTDIPSAQYIPELTGYPELSSFAMDKGKPDQSQGRKATGPRFLRDVAAIVFFEFLAAKEVDHASSSRAFGSS